MEDTTEPSSSVSNLELLNKILNNYKLQIVIFFYSLKKQHVTLSCGYLLVYLFESQNLFHLFLCMLVVSLTYYFVMWLLVSIFIRIVEFISFIFCMVVVRFILM